MLTQSITDIKAEAAGTISAAKKPTKWDDKKHPLATWIQGDKDVRERIINSPKVCGIGFITPNNRFRLLQGVASWGDLTDPAMKMMVIGHVGAKTQNPKPSALPLAAVTREFQQIRKKVDEEGEPPSWFKMGKNNIRDWTPKTGEPTIDLPTDTDDWRIVAYPVAIPLVYGHKLITGDINNADVRAQLVDYHPAMEGWLDAISLQLITGKPLGDTKKVTSKYLPKLSAGLTYSAKGFPVTAPMALSNEEENEAAGRRLACGSVQMAFDRISQMRSGE